MDEVGIQTAHKQQKVSEKSDTGASSIVHGSVTLFFSAYLSLQAAGVGAVTLCSSFFF
jgi:hypothetical protein